MTETWLSNDVSSSEYFDNTYNVFRSNKHLKCRGVLVAVKTNYVVEEVSLMLPDLLTDLDIVVLNVYVGRLKLCLINVYIPPSSSTLLYELFFEFLEERFCVTQRTLILGDFNIPDLYDCLRYGDSGNYSYSAACNILVSFMNFNSLVQKNEVVNDRGRVLDVVLISEDLVSSVSRYSDPFVSEDAHHPSLLANIEIAYSKVVNFNVNNNTYEYNFANTDFLGLYNAFAALDLSEIEHITDVNEACELMHDKIFTLLDTFVPKRKCNRTQYPCWYTRSIIHKIKLKQKLRKLFKETGFLMYKDRFRSIRKELKQEIKKEYNEYIRRAENKIYSDPKVFWSFINSKKGTSRIPGKMVFRNSELTSPQQIVDAFAEHFKSVYVNSNAEDVGSDTYKSGVNANVLHQFVITESDVVGAASKLKSNFTMGPDGIPSFMVKDTIRCLSRTLCYLFNLIIQKALFPDVWKVAKVCPVFKSNSKDDITNYRPIALISNFAKLFESILSNVIYNHVQSVISYSQHGFVAGRSTVTNLCESTQFISEALDCRKQVDVIYTDLSKAFDRVNQKLLLCKLGNIGLCPKLINLLASIVQGRMQYVQYKGFKSQNYLTCSGVAQGSTLGPLLFVIYINDVADIFSNCNAFMYADDLKLVKVINTEFDCVALQNDINNLLLWCNNNFLDLNINKCRVITFSRKSNVILNSYHIGGNELVRCEQYRDLGVIMDRALTFVPHIDFICNQAMKMLGFIMRNSKEFMNVYSLELLFNAFILSRLQYCSPVWSPHYLNHINCIERIQRKFYKYLFLIKNSYYPERGYPYNLLLLEFNQMSLYLRRKYACIMFVYKILHGLLNCPSLLFQLKIYVPRLGSRSNMLLYYNAPRTNHHLNSPIINMSRCVNEVDLYIDIFNCTLRSFSQQCKCILNAICNQ